MSDRPVEPAARTPNHSVWRLAAVILGVVAVALFFLSGYLLVRHAVQSIQIAFAEDMADIFAQMREEALRSNPSKAEGCLESVVRYYPSGTKLPKGSRLDRIVERERARVVADIIAYLRGKTGEDLGDDPEPWIKRHLPQ